MSVLQKFTRGHLARPFLRKEDRYFRGMITQRDCTPPEDLTAMKETATSSNLEPEEVVELLRERGLDVHLNGAAIWSGDPEKARSCTKGSYLVQKKWLSCTEKRLLVRNLRSEEARRFSAMVGCIATLLLLGPELDANYRYFVASATPLQATVRAP